MTIIPTLEKQGVVVLSSKPFWAALVGTGGHPYPYLINNRNNQTIYLCYLLDFIYFLRQVLTL